MEGIKKAHEVWHDRHAPVLILLVFRAEDILTRRVVQFSDGNMQSNYTDLFSTDEEFQQIAFDLVFHEGVYNPSTERGNEIKRSRCAEVLLPSPFRLADDLQAILCRSPAERAALLHLLGDVGRELNGKVRVFTQPGLFQNSYAYMNTVDGTPDGVDFTFHPRRDGASVRTEMWVWDSNGNQVMHFDPTDLDPSAPWEVKKSLGPGTYTVRFEVEGCFAYEAPFIVDDLPF